MEHKIIALSEIACQNKISLKGTLYTTIVPAATLFPMYYSIINSVNTPLSFSLPLLLKTSLRYVSFLGINIFETSICSIIKQKGWNGIKTNFFSSKDINYPRMIAFAQYGLIATTIGPLWDRITSLAAKFTSHFGQEIGFNTTYDYFPFITKLGQTFTKFSLNTFQEKPLIQISGDLKGISLILFFSIIIPLLRAPFWTYVVETNDEVNKSIIESGNLKYFLKRYLKKFLSHLSLANLGKDTKTALGWGLLYFGTISTIVVGAFPLVWVTPIMYLFSIPFDIWMAKRKEKKPKPTS
ncbi:MAG: hypothetical protein KKA19_07620 [Candidatus Margulisbacteria bacterium]|nr:hypothetical protein [Candidatus Margulisiibacteriota bacterium]